jgi:hypothetical protein
MLNLEDSPARLDQIGLDTEFSLQFFRQTGGFGSIISTTAVRDLAGPHVFLNLLGIDVIARRVYTRQKTDHDWLFNRIQGAVFFVWRFFGLYADSIDVTRRESTSLSHCNK